MTTPTGRPESHAATRSDASRGGVGTRRAESGSGSRRAQPGPPSFKLRDSRGLTALGGVLLALVVGLAGAVIDMATGDGLRAVFAVLFVAGCVAAAMLVHREDIVAVILMPPLLYVAIAVLVGIFDSRIGNQSWLGREVSTLAFALVTQSQVLLFAVLGAVIVGVVRVVRFRAGVRRGVVR